ncbi:MAG: GNAT family N-acetyltransferase [Rhodothermaceae bacterium]|nr:GNAT family N-acetyltransferase [Rhodothermaceae bacterium]
MDNSMPFSIRDATPDDALAMVGLIRELADYEQLLHEANPNVEQLQKHLSAETNPRCEALVALDDDTGQIVGMALYFHNYSTFLTQWGLFLEDLFVKPSYRGKGIGFALLKRLAAIALERDCQRLDWNVLDWNELALSFYEKIGAKQLSDWRTMRLTGDALNNLGTKGKTD